MSGLHRPLVVLCVVLPACGHPAEDDAQRSYTTNVTLSGGDDGCDVADTDREVDVDARRSLIETSQAALAELSMSGVLSAIATNDGLPASPAALHDQLFDTFGVAPGLGLGGHCDDELDKEGNATLNGFPLQCPRAEAALAGRIEGWFPIAAVNRFDLAPTDGADCGEARLVFANLELGPAFVIFEAKVPNPDPGCGLAACEPVQEFWASLSTIDNPAKRASRLHEAFLAGDPALLAAGVGPFMRAGAFGIGAGQIRTNTFVDFPWTLREFKLVATHRKQGASDAKPLPLPGPLPTSTLQAVQVPVAATPFGEIFDDDTSLAVTASCRQAFLDASVPALMTHDVNLMAVDVPLECLAAESANDFSTRYDLQLDVDGEMWGRIFQRLVGIDPFTDLDPTFITRRAAFAGSCIGCHNEATGIDLGAGPDSPHSAGFVHVDGFNGSTACGDGTQDCFGISEALQLRFLPHREAVMEQFLSQGQCCDVGGLDEGFGDALPIDPFEVEVLETIDATAVAEAEAAADAAVSAQTIGGAPSRRAH